MEIDVVIKKAMIFGGLLAFVFGTFAIATALTQMVFSDLLGWGRFLSIVPSSVLIIIMYRPLEYLLVKITDKYFFQKKYDYKMVLRQYIHDIRYQLDIDQLMKGTYQIIDGTLHPEKQIYYVNIRTENKFVEKLIMNDGDGKEPKVDKNGRIIEREVDAIGLDSDIVKYLEDKRCVIDLEDDKYPQKIRESIIKDMKDRKCVLVIPIEEKKAELIGMMLLGPKKSGEYYSQDDIEILVDIASAKGFAITNINTIDELTKTKTLEGLGSMADGMSHQFNNIFASMTNQLEFQEMTAQEELEKIAELPAEERARKLKDILNQTINAITKVSNDAFRGGKLAKSVLIHTRPDKAGFQVQDISKLFDSAFELVRFNHKDVDQTLELTKDIPANLPYTFANESLIQNIYHIALNNAYDAIKMRYTNNPDDKEYQGKVLFKIFNNTATNHIQIEIYDNGQGMRPDALKSVNQGVPYFTTKGSSIKKSGFGAGVHTLAKYVGLHGGRYNFQSLYGEHTILTIEIPIRKEPLKEAR
jgi:signal transduction histidine kinase